MIIEHSITKICHLVHGYCLTFTFTLHTQNNVSANITAHFYVNLKSLVSIIKHNILWVGFVQLATVLQC